MTSEDPLQTPPRRKHQRRKRDGQRHIQTHAPLQTVRSADLEPSTERERNIISGRVSGLDRLTILVKQLELKLDVVIGEVPRNSEQKRYITVTLGLTIDQPAPAM